MRFYTKVMLGAASVLLPVAAQAATATTSFVINGSVVANCTIGSAPLTFAAYSGAQVSTSTNLSPNCTNGTPYTIAIDNGATGTAPNARKLTSTTSSSTPLTYSLYTSNTYATAWGTTTGTDTVPGTGTGAIQTVTVYGRIAAGQNVGAATDYTDTVNVTLTF